MSDRKHYEGINIKDDLEKSFLQYSMSVITSRAIPDARDGLKPVNRRIVFAMNGLGLTYDKQFKKSARVVGEVIGKYHPHGEQSVYGSLVHLAQEFSMNYPLVLGHGNFGSIDGDPPAAQRYTEAKLSKISTLLSNDINKETVDFRDNYDGTEREPVVLPCYFPNLLVNGTFGIAVGMSTIIPPHNLTEISNAIIKVASNPNVTNAELLTIVNGPDFPTGGEIHGNSGIEQAYLYGYGKYILQSKYKIEEKNKVISIIIFEIPFTVNKSEVISKIGFLSRNKEITEISDLKDESSHGKIRLKIVLKKNVDVKVFMNKLFKKTDLQKRMDINMLALVNNKPKTLTLRDALEVYIKHQKEIIIRRTKYMLKKANDRIHILKGLIIALNNIDEVVKIIKEAKDPSQAKAGLMNRFDLSDVQAKSILETQLQRLTNLEVEKIQSEHKSLEEKIKDYEDILNNEYRVINIIINQQKENIKKFGRERKTIIHKGQILELTDEELMNDDDVYVTISNLGYLRRIDYNTFKTQGRGGKGIGGIGLYEGDYAKWLITSSTKSRIIFVTDKGKIYSLKAYFLPLVTKTAKGIPITHLIDKLDETKEKLSSIISEPKDAKYDYLIFVTKKGYIVKIAFSDFKKINVSGKKGINLLENDKVVNVHFANVNNQVIIASSKNKLVRFDLDSIKQISRNSRGVRAIKLDDNDFVVSSEIINENNEIFIFFDNLNGKKIQVSKIRKTCRNSKGVLSISKKVKANIIKVCKVSKEDDLLFTTKNGTVLRISSNDIRLLSRTASGSRVIKLSEGDKAINVITMPHKDEETELLETSENLKENVPHGTSDK